METLPAVPLEVEAAAPVEPEPMERIVEMERTIAGMQRTIAGMQDQIVNLHELREEQQEQLNRATGAIAALQLQAPGQRGRSWSSTERWHPGGYGGGDRRWQG